MICISSSVSWGEHGGGLVQHQHLRPATEGLDDLHPLLSADGEVLDPGVGIEVEAEAGRDLPHQRPGGAQVQQSAGPGGDRKSTRLNSSHVAISYAVFCLTKNIEAEEASSPAWPH